MINEINFGYAALLLIPGLLVAFPLLRIVKQFFYNRKLKAAGGVRAPASSNNPFTRELVFVTLSLFNRR